MVISAFVRPLHAVLVHHSRFQSIQNDILPPLGGWWWFASGNSGLCFQQYIASRAEAVSSVVNLPLGGEAVPALVAAPCRALREVGVAVIAITAPPPTGAEAGTSTLLAPTAPLTMVTDAGTSTLLALAALPPTGTDAGTSTLLALAATPPTGTDAGTSTLLAITLSFSMRTRFVFRFLCYFNTCSNRPRHELGRVCGSSLHFSLRACYSSILKSRHDLHHYAQ
jgi:hypothetical protein